MVCSISVSEIKVYTSSQSCLKVNIYTNLETDGGAMLQRLDIHIPASCIHAFKISAVCGRFSSNFLSLAAWTKRIITKHDKNLVSKLDKEYFQITIENRTSLSIYDPTSMAASPNVCPLFSSILTWTSTLLASWARADEDAGDKDDDDKLLISGPEPVTFRLGVKEYPGLWEAGGSRLSVPGVTAPVNRDKQSHTHTHTHRQTDRQTDHTQTDRQAERPKKIKNKKYRFGSVS